MSSLIQMSADLKLIHNRNGLILIDIYLKFKNDTMEVIHHYMDNELDGGCDYSTFLSELAQPHNDIKRIIHLTDTYTKSLGIKSSLTITIDSNYIEFYHLKMNLKYFNLNDFIRLMEKIKSKSLEMIQSQIESVHVDLKGPNTDNTRLWCHVCQILVKTESLPVRENIVRCLECGSHITSTNTNKEV